MVGGWWINGESCVVSIVAAWDVGELALIIKDTSMEWLQASGLVTVGVLRAFAKVDGDTIVHAALVIIGDLALNLLATCAVGTALHVEVSSVWRHVGFIVIYFR